MINGTHHIPTHRRSRPLSRLYCDLLGLPLISKSLVEPGMLPGFERLSAHPGLAWVAQLSAGNLVLRCFAMNTLHRRMGAESALGCRHPSHRVRRPASTTVPTPEDRRCRVSVELTLTASLRSVYMRDGRQYRRVSGSFEVG